MTPVGALPLESWLIDPVSSALDMCSHASGHGVSHKATFTLTNSSTVRVSIQGVKAVISESFERIHRSNLVGMGIMPLEYLPGENAESLSLTGKESYTIEIPEDLKTGQTLAVKVRK